MLAAHRWHTAQRLMALAAAGDFSRRLKPLPA
jgi:hypothetical protein